jgi:SAM-dependent methyltransferase
MQPDYVEENRRTWNEDAPNWVAAGETAWASDVPTWGQWAISEDEVGLLPADMNGMTAIELGCGTGYVSRWMERRGASVVAIDVSEAQLATARRLAKAYGSRIEWLHGNAEAVPYPDGSFDFAVSEYGAALWCDPHVWIPEVVRLLRPGGRLSFLTNSPMLTPCLPLDGSKAGFTLVRPYFGQHMFDWSGVEIDPGGVEFNLAISDWFSLFSEHGLEVVDFLELQAPESAQGMPFVVPADWAKKYPSEIVWKLRKQY